MRVPRRSPCCWPAVGDRVGSPDADNGRAADVEEASRSKKPEALSAVVVCTAPKLKRGEGRRRTSQTRS
eukprot:scaffold5925_cov122-Isochrysis_galbana.AAC.7